jgi:hypothetical protein
MQRFDAYYDSVLANFPAPDQGAVAAAGSWPTFQIQPYQGRSQPPQHPYNEKIPRGRIIDQNQAMSSREMDRNDGIFLRGPDPDRRNLRSMSIDSMPVDTVPYLPVRDVPYRFTKTESPRAGSGVYNPQNHGAREILPASFWTDHPNKTMSNQVSGVPLMYAPSGLQPRRSSLKFEVRSDDALLDTPRSLLSPIKSGIHQRRIARGDADLNGAWSKLRRAEKLSQKLRDLQALCESKEVQKSQGFRAAISVGDPTSKSRSILSQPQVLAKKMRCI